MRRPHALTLLLVTICLSGLAGCGHARVVNGSRAVDVSVNEYRINPASVRAPAGVLVINVRNYGRLAHDLVVSENGQTTAATKPLRPGQSTQLALNLAPGTYSIASTLLSDQDLGIYGTLTVTP